MNTRFNQVAACLTLVVVTAACSGQSQSTSNETGQSAATMAPQATMAAPAAPKTLTVHIGALNGSGETGTATLTRVGAKTRVVIALAGEKATGDQPAHIHKGTCAKLDPKPAYALHDVVLGKSDTVVAESLDELAAGSMAINVHKSTADLATYVACGDIH